jgi:transposase
VGRHVLDAQSPHRCPEPESLYRARPGPLGVARSQPQGVVGMDVAKAPRDSAVRPTAARWAVAHDAAGMAALVAQRPAMVPTLLVREATGPSQRAVVAALAAAGLPVVVVHPRHARDCAKATGPRATTAGLDARA